MKIKNLILALALVVGLAAFGENAKAQTTISSLLISRPLAMPEMQLIPQATVQWGTTTRSAPMTFR